MLKSCLISLLVWFLSVGLAASAPAPVPQRLQMVINLPGRTLEVFEGSRLIKLYPVAVGKASTPTPVGVFFITDKEMNPAWYPPQSPGTVVASGPHNPLGYRWLGFLPTYGVHGTNDPDSIGRVISNGCVRMYEADVEELYDLVGLHTPLKIVYERIRTGIDEYNRPYFAIYPDIYGRQPLSVTAVNKFLQTAGWQSLLEDSAIRRMLASDAAQEFAFLQFNHLFVNGRALAEKVRVVNGELLVPVQAVADIVKASLVWDEAAGRIYNGSRQFAGVRLEGVLYVAPAGIDALFGGDHRVDPAKAAVEIRVLSLTLNGITLAGDSPLYGEPPLLPVLTVAEALGQSVFWDEKTKILMVNNLPVPARVVGGKPYLEISRVYAVFQAYAYWDEAAGVIDLTYPFHEPK
ncbi:MAG: L,D-transpeptidase family protein [Sporomusaceae bacterium]|nr:L,D-transpeptidase family protein [Sporomusaceae bacterium]